MVDDKVIKLLEIHEGNIPYAYHDSKGYLTIGIGFLIDNRKGGRLEPEEIQFILRTRLQKLRSQLARSLPFFERLNDPRQAVLLDMAWTLGLQGLLGFTKTMGYLEQGNYVEAAKEMLRSDWRDDVGPNRSRRLSAMMSTGRWPSIIVEA